MDLEADAVQALQALQDASPAISKDYPVLTPFLPLIGIALSAVQTVKDATGHDTAGAVASVASTLTPGLPNAPALTDSGPAPADGGIDGSHVDAAANAADSGATAAAAVQAVQALPVPQPAAS